MNREIPAPAAYAADLPRAAQDDAERDSDLFSVSMLLVSLWRMRYAIMGVALVVTLAIGALVMRIESAYTATSEVQLLRSERNVIDIENIIATTPFGDADVLNEISIIQSPAILFSVAERLELARYPEFQSAPSALGNAIRLARSLLGSRDAADPSGAGEKAPPTPTEIAVGILAENISVKQVGLSFILSVSATASDPDLAADIANAMVGEYLGQQVAYKRDVTEQATVWLTDRVADLLNQLDAAEAAVEAARAAIAAEGVPSGDVIGQQIAELSSLLVTSRIAHAEAVNLKTAFDALIAAGQYASAAQIVSSPALLDSGERLTTIRRQLATLTERGGDSLAVNRLISTRDEVEDGLKAVAADIAMGLQAAVDVAAGKMESIQRSNRELELMLSTQSAKTRELRVLERQLETIQQVYQVFLTRLTEARERGSFQEPNARIVSAAGPPDQPSAPRRGQLIVIVFVLTAAMTAAAALALDARRDGVKSAAQASRLVGAPVLASMSRNSRDNDERALIGGQLLAALVLRGGQARRVVLVASSVPGEDASAVARLVAAQAAATGLRVALVLGDPEGGPDASEGCTTMSLEKLLADCGKARIPATYAGLVKALRDAYDFVVIEAAPVLASADTQWLARSADAIILALRWNHTPRGAVRLVLERLGWSGLAPAGVVLTGVSASTAASYGYPGETAVARLLRHPRVAA